MLETALDIEFLSAWHVGSGLGDGAIADAVLNRDIYGIPVISGSAVKGALREGAWRLALARPAELNWLVKFVFGSASLEDASNSPGIVTVGAAMLPEDFRCWLVGLAPKQRADLIADMTVVEQRTSLDKFRMVVPHSLRSIECGIAGLRFGAELSLAAPDESVAWLESWLAAVCACVKSIGGDRSRGMGRCRFSLRNQAAEPVRLPGPLPEALRQIQEKEENR